MGPGSHCKCATRTIINQGDSQSEENLYKYLIKRFDLGLFLLLSLLGFSVRFLGARQVN